METDKYIICPNCENEFDSEFHFCPYCGQANKKYKLNFHFLMSELLSANFNLDNKFLTTLKLLIIAPGKLTTEFLLGKRTKYISPIRLYLLISFVYFFVMSLNFGDNEGFMNSNKDNKVETDSVGISKLVDVIADDRVLTNIGSTDGFFDGFEESARKKAIMINTEAGKHMFMRLFRKYTSIGMFVLIPVMALLFFLIFHRGTYYYQHLIFSFHLQSVFFLWFILFNIIDWFIQYDIVLYIKNISVIIILFVWVKKYYRRSIWSSIRKVIVFLIGYGIVIVLFFFVVLAISFFNLEGLNQ